jgi:hypothetical protein
MRGTTIDGCGRSARITHDTRKMTKQGFWIAVLAVSSIAVAGCKDATLGPTGSGWIEGVVLHAETGEPLERVSITTTPASNALVTDAEGQFTVEDLEIGNYQISARKAGYQQTTVSVAVRPHRPAIATIFLQVESRSDPRAALEVQVLSYWNTVRGDSTIAEAEFQVRNVGDVAVSAWDVDFRVATTAGDRFLQERGDGLGVGRSEIRRFSTYIGNATATGVQVESIWTDPPLGSPDD